MLVLHFIVYCWRWFIYDIYFLYIIIIFFLLRTYTNTSISSNVLYSSLFIWFSFCLSDNKTLKPQACKTIIVSGQALSCQYQSLSSHFTYQVAFFVAAFPHHNQTNVWTCGMRFETCSREKDFLVNKFLFVSHTKLLLIFYETFRVFSCLFLSEILLLFSRD